MIKINNSVPSQGNRVVFLLLNFFSSSPSSFRSLIHIFSGFFLALVCSTNNFRSFDLEIWDFKHKKYKILIHMFLFHGEEERREYKILVKMMIAKWGTDWSIISILFFLTMIWIFLTHFFFVLLSKFVLYGFVFLLKFLSLQNNLKNWVQNTHTHTNNIYVLKFNQFSRRCCYCEF